MLASRSPTIRDTPVTRPAQAAATRAAVAWLSAHGPKSHRQIVWCRSCGLTSAAAAAVAVRTQRKRRLKPCRFVPQSRETEALSQDLHLGDDVPSNALALGGRAIAGELGQLAEALRGTPLAGLAGHFKNALRGVDPRPPQEMPEVVQQLVLDVDKVVERERARGVPQCSPVVGAVFFALSWSLDRLYEGRPIQKFWVLETIARLPYFSFVSVLHLYESLGWWRTPQLRDIHNAEEHNELHHLLIMEALGGSCAWVDRLMARTAAVAYYWVVVFLFVANPELAYNFSVLVEEHAYVTYAEFVAENEELLRQIPPPPIATRYYLSGDLYYFDKFQTSNRKEVETSRRRPPCDNLLDVFRNIRDDEYEHIQTMKACEDWCSGEGPTPLPAAERGALGDREAWQEWSREVNSAAE